MWVPLYIGTWFAVNQPSSSKIGRSPKPTDCVLVSVQTESFFTKVRVWIVYPKARRDHPAENFLFRAFIFEI